jgi:hypothetical protein
MQIVRSLRHVDYLAVPYTSSRPELTNTGVDARGLQGRSLQQLGGAQLERAGEFGQGGERDVKLAALDRAVVAAVKAGEARNANSADFAICRLS